MMPPKLNPSGIRGMPQTTDVRGATQAKRDDSSMNFSTSNVDTSGLQDYV
jgi:hypothetical protein